jgi:hypothetical protein
LSDVFISSQCITRKGEEEEEEEKDGLDMVEIAHPMSYFKKKKRSWDECVMAWLRFRDPPSVAQSVGAPQHPPTIAFPVILCC